MGVDGLRHGTGGGVEWSGLCVCSHEKLKLSFDECSSLFNIGMERSRWRRELNPMP